MKKLKTKVTNEMIHAAYSAAKGVYEKTLSRKEEIKNLNFDYGINKGTASDLINNFNYMMQGRVYARTLSAYAAEYYLSNIHNDYGRGGLKIALKSLNQHIIYYEGLGSNNSRMHTQRNIYEKFNKIIDNSENINEEEQEVIFSQVKDRKREDLIRDLNSLTKSEAEIVQVNHKLYKRENAIIAKIKLLRGFKCQICGLAIPKSTGGVYVEAAHITPKSEKGGERPNNIMILCPNHHKEFDYGNPNVVERNDEFIEFEMNSKNYKVPLSV